jgi:hypothetical protein
MLYVFVGCLAFGACYALLSFILGELGGDHNIDADHGGFDLQHGDIDIQHGGFDLQHDGLDVQHDGIDLQQDGDAGSDSSGSPSPFSPVVMASAITTFGAVGLISMKGFGMSGFVSTVIALAFAGTIGAAIFFGVVKLMYGQQSNSVFSLAELTDKEAEVITPIPAKGYGEVAFLQGGVRYTLPARSIQKVNIARGSAVLIREINSGVAEVEQKLTLDDVELNAHKIHDETRNLKNNN